MHDLLTSSLYLGLLYGLHIVITPPQGLAFTGQAFIRTCKQGCAAWGVTGARQSPVFDIVEAKVEADGLGQQGQQGPLLQLVIQDGCVTLTPACTHFQFCQFRTCLNVIGECLQL